VHRYWLSKEGKEEYIYVKFRQYFLPKPIPISCIEDSKIAAKKLNEYLINFKDHPNDHAIKKLKEMADNADKF